MKEKISALMDGDMEQGEMQALIRELRQDPEQKDCWEHYHLIGDAMRKGLPAKMESGFAARISDAVAKEDLPVPSSSSKAAATSEQAEDKRVFGFAKPAAGFAVAASVAMVAYLGFGVVTVDDQLGGSRLADTTLPNNQIITAQAPQGLQFAHQQVAPAQQPYLDDHIRWDVARPAVESRLNNYLYNHQNQSSQAQINTRMMPNARIVIYTPNGQ